MNKTLSVLAFLTLVSFPNFAWAESDPSPSGTDSRVRYLTYERDQVYKLLVAPSRVMTIVFDEEENISSLQAGDTFDPGDRVEW